MIAALAAVLSCGSTAVAAATCVHHRGERVLSGKLDYAPIRFLATRLSHAQLASAVRGSDKFEFSSGDAIRSKDPSLYMIQSFLPSYSIARLRSGEFLFLKPSRNGRGLEDVHIAASPEKGGAHSPDPRLLPQRATNIPKISRYRYVQSERIMSFSDSHLGLWRKVSGKGSETLIVRFSDQLAAAGRQASHAIVGETQLKLVALSPPSTLHGVGWDVKFVTEARCGDPVWILSYSWYPGRPSKSK